MSYEILDSFIDKEEDVRKLYKIELFLLSGVGFFKEYIREYDLKQLDIEQLQKEARVKKVNVYTLIKREINYRKVKKHKEYQNCFTCKMSEKINYGDYYRFQCHWIGIINDSTADIREDCICNSFKRGYGKKLTTEVENGKTI